MPVEHDVTEAAGVAAGVVSDEVVGGGGFGRCRGWCGPSGS